jgi:hypothetical protein
MAPEARRITDANSQCGAGAVSAGVQQRWIVLGADARHVSLGRTEPSEVKVMAASDALAAQGLSGCLARMHGDYYSRPRVTLEPLQRIGAEHDADWQGALTEFHATRQRRLTMN